MLVGILIKYTTMKPVFVTLERLESDMEKASSSLAVLAEKSIKKAEILNFP